MNIISLMLFLSRIRRRSSNIGNRQLERRFKGIIFEDMERYANIIEEWTAYEKKLD